MFDYFHLLSYRKFEDVLCCSDQRDCVASKQIPGSNPGTDTDLQENTLLNPVVSVASCGIRFTSQANKDILNSKIIKFNVFLNRLRAILCKYNIRRAECTEQKYYNIQNEIVPTTGKVISF